MTVLIPAYEPDARLVTLAEELKERCSFSVVVVDDGSGSSFAELFRTLRERGCHVLTHDVNRGKGSALKTGFKYLIDVLGENDGVITADADGQHLVRDIARIAELLPTAVSEIILGERTFGGNVPTRSKIGNWVSYFVFRVISGQSIRDTQTGLRGFPADLLPWLLNVSGERFEYESNMLMEAGRLGIKLQGVGIDTVYIDGNKSTHYRTLRDSARIFVPFLKFCVSGLLSAGIDFSLLFIFHAVTKNLLVSVVGARAVSSVFNFTVNKLHVFKSAKGYRRTSAELLKYYLLVAVILILNYGLMHLLNLELGVTLFWSKIVTEVLLFFVSYSVQKTVIFRKVSAVTYDSDLSGQASTQCMRRRPWKNTPYRPRGPQR